MHKNATKCNKTLSKWCKNKHGASKIIDMLETYQKSAKAATTKAKKAEKALADANQGRIQREEAITKGLNQVSALAGGEYLSALCIVCFLTLLVVTYYPFCFYLQRKLGYLWRRCSRLMKILSWQR
jgi:hypothetical protein